ncbi:GNAT family N-acetyltransferase [Paenibacillus gorillae]|uniref:GNAT family N-acetyltransferase n=1 Tax=Paenibacillus gorillae TaxID=1243662 RepID=UPI0004B79F64|nr:N-acetyltransferase [Paenibacillus gorillae]
MNIRTESPQDYDAVYALHDAAFGNQDEESQMVERIRKSENFVPELSIVAEQGGEIVGHLLISGAALVDQELRQEVMVLAPLAVSPTYQKQGIGSALMQEGLDRCRAMGHGLVLLIGHPAYYPRFGFKPVTGLTLKQFDVPADVFMVNELIEGALSRAKGELLYPAAFFG